MSRTLPARTRPPADLMSSERPSEAQTNFVTNLLEEKDLKAESALISPVVDGPELIRRYEEGTLTKRECSALISWLKMLPSSYQASATAGRTADLPDVPSGRYAIGFPNAPLKFYRVKRPDSGKWNGWTFVDEQRSDEFYSVRGLKNVRPILEAIMKDPRAAAHAYGYNLGKCCQCGRTLTNEVSRFYGIGPICAGRTGWFDREELTQLKMAGE